MFLWKWLRLFRWHVVDCNRGNRYVIWHDCHFFVKESKWSGKFLIPNIGKSIPECYKQKFWDHNLFYTSSEQRRLITTCFYQQVHTIFLLHKSAALWRCKYYTMQKSGPGYRFIKGVTQLSPPHLTFEQLKLSNVNWQMQLG